MKKIFFVILIIWLSSCVTKIPPEAPILSVTPDTNLSISPINPIVFTIDGSGAEKLIDFTIETNPFFYEYDTIFDSFVHFYTQEITVFMPDILPGLEVDSTADVIFSLNDGFHKTQKVIPVTIKTGFPMVLSDSTSLTFDVDSSMFYSTIYEMPLSFDSHESPDIDLVLIYDDQIGFTLASPDAVYVSQKMYSLGYTYSNTGKNHTKITPFSTSWQLIDDKFLYYVNVSESYINSNSGYGVGVSGLEIGDMLAFECDDERKGVLRVTNLNPYTKTLSFVIKSQYTQ